MLLARGCTQSKSLIGLGWPGGSKGPSPEGPATSPSTSSHLPLDKLVPIVAGERPAKGERPQDVRAGRTRSHQSGKGGSKFQCFSPRGPCTHTRGQPLKTSGLAKFAQANHYPHCHLWWNPSRARGLPSESGYEKTQTCIQLRRLLCVKGRKVSEPAAWPCSSSWGVVCFLALFYLILFDDPGPLFTSFLIDELMS